MNQLQLYFLMKAGQMSGAGNIFQNHEKAGTPATYSWKTGITVILYEQMKVLLLSTGVF